MSVRSVESREVRNAKNLEVGNVDETSARAFMMRVLQPHFHNDDEKILKVYFPDKQTLSSLENISHRNFKDSFKSACLFSPLLIPLAIPLFLIFSICGLLECLVCCSCGFFQTMANPCSQNFALKEKQLIVKNTFVAVTKYAVYVIRRKIPEQEAVAGVICGDVELLDLELQETIHIYEWKANDLVIKADTFELAIFFEKTKNMNQKNEQIIQSDCFYNAQPGQVIAFLSKTRREAKTLQLANLSTMMQDSNNENKLSTFIEDVPVNITEQDIKEITAPCIPSKEL